MCFRWIVKPKLAQAVVDSLSFSNEEFGRVDFEQFSQRDWQRTLPWLHDNGIALYFLQKLKNANAGSAIALPVLACLETLTDSVLRGWQLNLSN